MAAPTPSGTVIANTATLVYQVGSGSPQTVLSNTVQATTTLLHTPSTTALLRYGPGLPGATSELVGPTMCRTGSGSYQTLPAPKPGAGGSLSTNAPQPLADAGVYHQGDAIFVQVTDQDKNLDPFVRDTVDVVLKVPATDDVERVRLTETGGSTGVFAGYIQSDGSAASPHDCALQVRDNSEVEVQYTDSTDPTDVTQDQAPVDPLGIVFDSTTGKRLDGARITVVDAATGQPAQVLADDGISTYPSTVVSGKGAKDSSGHRYIFESGTFRLPLLPPGNYRLKVEPPTGYTSPSTATESQLQALPGAPYTLAPASFEKDFRIKSPAPEAVDIPLDPMVATLYVQKTASTEMAAVGDFVQFTVTVQNTSQTLTAVNVNLLDTLPQGMRYASGSARLANVRIADPTISADGLQLTFPVGSIAPNSTVTLQYVVEITAAAQMGPAINRAQAYVITQVASNEATAQVVIHNDLFSDVNTLVGRVIVDGCDGKPGAEGLPNARVFMETGTYAVTDKDGRFHFQGVDNGTHVVQLDTATLPKGYEVVDCVHNTRFAGRDYSQFVELHGGALWRVDFHVRKIPPPAGSVSLQLSQIPGGDGHTLQDVVDLMVAGVPVHNLRVMAVLPDGLLYVPGSAALDGAAISEPDDSAGALLFHLPDAAADWHGVLTFQTRQQTDASGDLTTKAIATFDTPADRNQHTPPASVTFNAPAPQHHHETLTIEGFSSGSASLTKRDLQTLEHLAELLKIGSDVHIDVVGYTDNVPVAPGTPFTDNKALSLARAQAVERSLRERLDLSHATLSVDGRGESDPVASNDSEDGRRLNRRTQIEVDYDTPPAGSPASSSQSETVQSATVGASEADSDSADAGVPKYDFKAQGDFKLDRKWLSGTDSSPLWISPADGWLPAIQTISVAIRHGPQQRAVLSVNGTQVDPVNFQGITRNAANTVAVSQWLGVTLKEGDNLLTADILEGDKVVQHLQKNLHYSGPPVRAELVPGKSVLVADGKTKPVIAVKLYDRWGYPARAGTVGRYTLQDPYQAYQSVQDLQQQQLMATGPREPTYTVQDDGTAYIVLAPTNTAGQVTLDVPLQDDKHQELRPWLQAGARDWILVGVASGTTAFNDISGHMQTASGDDPNNDIFEDGRVAFYAKGMIKGAYLMTVAYDTAKQTGVEQQGLQQTVDPNAYFMLYGDASEQANDAVSASKLYIKIERNQFYAMFGDYNTGLTVTELSQYDRVFNGAKSEYNGEHLTYSAFAAQNAQSYVKDEIQGDGTSGLYHLSHPQIIMDSESVVIETRDRYQTDRVLSTQPLTRYLDYNIDYFSGTIFFKQPVPARDSNFNPVFIVAQYEVDHGGDQQVTGGGRVAAKFNDDKVEVGTTLISEGAGAGQGYNKLAGADLRITLNQSTEFRAEVAHTDTAATNNTGLVPAPTGTGLLSSTSSTAGTGNAYLAELKTQTDKVESDVYLKQEDPQFGLGQQSLADVGMRKVGANGRYRLTDKLSLQGEAYQQDSLDGGGNQKVVDGGVQYQDGGDSATFGLRHSEESYSQLVSLPGTTSIGSPAVQPGDLQGGVTGLTGIAPGNYTSNQVYVGGSKGVFDNKLTLHAETDQNLGGQGADPLYPASTTLGADYKLTDTTSVYVNQQFINGLGQGYNEMTEVGVNTAPWSQAQVQSSVASQQTEYGPRTFSTMGLTQGYKVNDNLSLSLGMDRVATLRQPNTPVLDPNAPPVIGTQSEDFTSMFLGATYRKESWSWTGRAEALHSSSEKHRGLFTGFYKDLSGGNAYSLSLQAFDDTFDIGGKATTLDARMGIAHRPDDTRWTVLDQLDVMFADTQGNLGGLLFTPQQSLNQQQTSVSGADPTAPTGLTSFLDQRTWKIVNNLQGNYLYSERSQLSLYYGSKYARFDFAGDGYQGYTDLMGLEYRYDVKPDWDVGFIANRLHSWNSNVVNRSFGLETGWSFAKNMWVSIGYNFTGFYDSDFTAMHYTAQGIFVRFRFKFDQDTVRDMAEHGAPVHP